MASLAPPKRNLLSDAGIPTVTAWIETNVGGKVISMQRQARWRPIYFVDVEKDGQVRRLVVRGDRSDVPDPIGLEHEMLVQRMMYEHGVNVPRVYGWLDDPRCYVMDWVEGIPGFDGATEEQRRAVMTEYMKLLADMHKLPVQPFKDAGILHAADPSQSHTVGAEKYIEISYRNTKKRPDPFLEWALSWWRRHPIKPHGREALVTWDSGQFHQKDGKFVAMIDVELGHVGDPMLDLAGFRQRDTVLHYGDMRELYAIYEEQGGQPIDLDAIKWHYLFHTLTNALSFNTALAEPTPESDYMTNVQWVNETNRFALEAIAEILEIELPEVAIPEPEVTQVEPGFAQLVRSLTLIESGDEFVQHQVRILFRLARHLQRWDKVGRAMQEIIFDDVEALLGKRPATWQESEQMLEDFVLQDEGKHDMELIALFNRKLQFAQSLNGPVGSAMARHNPIQRFDGKAWG